MIKVVVFDFDGTLVDSNRIKDACMGKTVARIPGGPEALAAARTHGGNRYAVFAHVAETLEGAADSARIATVTRALIAAYTDCCRRGIAGAAERGGAREALITLKRRGYRIWINSATPAHNLPELLRRRGFLPYLDGYLGGPVSKIANLRRIAAAARARPREILMIGDGPDDLAAARAAHVWFVAVTAENRIPGRGPHAMTHLRGLAPLIARLAGGRRRARR